MKTKFSHVIFTTIWEEKIKMYLHMKHKQETEILDFGHENIYLNTTSPSGEVYGKTLLKGKIKIFDQTMILDQNLRFK